MASTKPKKKNPRLASGRKRVRQDVKLNSANTSLRSKYRTAVKNVEKAVLAALGAGGRPHRHEGLAERALAQHAPEEIGNAESDVEGVGQRAHAEHRAHQHIAHEAGDARGQGQQGDGGSGFEERHGGAV